MNEDTKRVVKLGTSATVALALLTSLGMWGCPKYVLEAKAKLESAKSLAGAEVERAKGVAEANEIIGDSLRGNDAYLRYLWIQGLSDGNSETIYVPTEANLPIMEATRRTAPRAPSKENDD